MLVLWGSFWTCLDSSLISVWVLMMIILVLLSLRYAGHGPPTPPPPAPLAQAMPSQQWEGADQVWGAVHVVVAMTGQWAIKPQGYGFMSHLVLSKVKGQGCMTCLTFNFSTIWGKPWTRQSSLTIDHRFIHEKVLVSVKIMSLKRCRHLRLLVEFI